MSGLTRFLHSIIQQWSLSPTFLAYPRTMMVVAQWLLLNVLCVSVRKPGTESVTRPDVSVTAGVCVRKHSELCGGGGRAEEGTSGQIWWSIYLTSVGLTWGMFSPDFSPLTLNKDSLRLI